MASFAIPSLNRQTQQPVDPNQPIAGAGGGIAPTPPPVNQVAPPTAPVLPPVNTMAPQHIGTGGRILSGVLGAFAPGVASLVPGTTEHNRAMEAQGLVLRPPQQKPTTRQRVGKALGAFGGDRSDNE